MSKMRSASEYTNALYQAIVSNYMNLMAPGCMYHGKDGALRLAREYGRGLADFPRKEALNEVGSSYGILCVRLFRLRPPIDAKEWVGEIRKALMW